jgi:hypothetical protein
MYEGNKEIPTVVYPSKYSLKTEQEEREEADQISELIPVVPSKTYQRQMMRELAIKLLAGKVSKETMDRIENEIEKAPGLTSDATQISQDLLSGIVDKVTAAKLRGYPEDVVEKANKEHIERLKEIQIAQAPGGGTGKALDNPAARGVPEASANPLADAAKEKRDGATE